MAGIRAWQFECPRNYQTPFSSCTALVWLVSPGIPSQQHCFSTNFLCASISCLALWTKEPRVSSGTDVHCAMDLVRVFPGAAQLRSFYSLPKAPAGAGSRWKQAPVGCILYQRYLNSFMQMSNRFHLKSWENKCLQTAAL